MTKIDKIILRQLYLQRYGSYLVNKNSELSIKLQRKVYKLVDSFVDNASPNELRALSNNTTSNNFVRALRAALNKELTVYSSALAGTLSDELVSLAEYESKFIINLYEKESEVVKGLSTLKKPVLGYKPVELVTGPIPNAKVKLWSELVRATQDNLHPLTYVKGNPDIKFKDGMLVRMQVNQNTAIRTATNGVANNARQLTYVKMKVNQVMVIATLDFRTSPVCRIRDHNVYDVAKALKPPYHYNCRTTLVPYTGKTFTRPYVKDERPVSKIPKDQRAAKIGRTTYSYAEWFGRLPKKDQLEILGPARYQMYKDKNLALEKFTDEQSGLLYSLTDLHKLTT